MISKYLILLLFCVLGTGFCHADEAQTINEILKKVSELKNKNDYDAIIKLMKDEIAKGNLLPIFFDIMGGAYDGKKNREEAYLSYLRGFLYNPSIDYARNNLTKKMNYIENRPEELEKESWLARYFIAKKSFDQGNLEDAEIKMGALLGEGKNIDVLCVINKDIKSLKNVPKETRAVMGNLTAAEAAFNRAISELGTNCPEFVYYEYGDLLMKAGRYEVAMEKIQISITKNPFRKDNKFKWGVCQLYTKKYIEAKQTFTQCIEKTPNYAEAFLYLGFSQWALKESDKAIKSFEKVVEMCQTNNTQLRDKAKKGIEVVLKGDLFLTPDDMNKLIPNNPPPAGPAKPVEDKKDKKDEQNNEKPIEQK